MYILLYYSPIYGKHWTEVEDLESTQAEIDNLIQNGYSYDDIQIIIEVDGDSSYDIIDCDDFCRLYLNR